MRLLSKLVVMLLACFLGCNKPSPEKVGNKGKESLPSKTSSMLAKPVIVAHVIGRNFDMVDKKIVVTENKQKVFHFHSDTTGGGTWYDAFIFIDGEYVKIYETDSVSNTDKDGNKKMTTNNDTYIFRISDIKNDALELNHANRIILSIESK